MNRKIKLALCWALLVLLLAAPCTAATYTFGDLYKEWPGIVTPKNADDTYGSPKIEGAVVVTDNGYLKAVRIQFLANSGIGLWYEGDYNSLFINSDWTGTELYDNWDYYVRGYFPGDFGSTNFADFSDFTVASYLLAPGWTYSFPTGDSRIGHPNGITDPTGLIADLATAKLPDKDSINSSNDGLIEIEYLFRDGGILLGNSFVIGYTPHCANDVFLAPVPEPTTVLLLGAGLSLGLFVHRRRKTSRLPAGDS